MGERNERLLWGKGGMAQSFFGKVSMLVEAPPVMMSPAESWMKYKLNRNIATGETSHAMTSLTILISPETWDLKKREFNCDVRSVLHSCDFSDLAADKNHQLGNCLLGRGWLGQGGGGWTSRWEGEKPPDSSSGNGSGMIIEWGQHPLVRRRKSSLSLS